MSKQYINTVSTGNAHQLDILDLEITNRYTITVSSDGYVNFWDNKQDETQNPKDLVTKIFINKIGLHHISTYETILPDSKFKIVILSLTSFDGQCYLKYFINDDITTLNDIAFVQSNKDNKSWSPGFYKDPMSKSDYFILTQSNGETIVYDLIISATEGDAKSVNIELQDARVIVSTPSSFPNCIAISQNEEKRLAIGYTNGDVLLYDLTSLKPIYTFKSTDVQHTAEGGQRTKGGALANSIPRRIAFSPGGSILAVARDNQSAGSITIYDAKYGENVGSLTTPSHSAKSKGGFAHDGWILGLSFNEDGKYLVTGGFDKCVRVWDVENRETICKIGVSTSDLDNTDVESIRDLDTPVVSGVKFIKKGIRGGLGGDTNEGLCIISFDRGIRWYREAGGI